MTVMVLAAGLAYSFWWSPLVRHRPGWLAPGDVWATYRGAHWVAWGALGDVYASQTHLVTFPGVLILLAPVSMITSALGLSEGYPILVSQPTAWLVLGPVILGLTAIPLCAIDALSESLGVSIRRRRELCVFEAAATWTCVAYWGHIEDALAVGLVAYAMVAGQRSRWRSCGWLMGAAVLMQPVSLLVLPTLWFWVPRGLRRVFAWRVLTPAALVVGLILCADFDDAWRALTKQPNYPTVDHPTPLLGLSPRLGGETVAAGPGRLIAVVSAMIVGAWVWRRGAGVRPVDVVWGTTLALAARCVFEPVMVPFYLTAPVSVALVLAAERGLRVLRSAGVLSVALLVVAHSRAGPLRWWLTVVALLTVVLLAAYPARTENNIGAADIPPSRRSPP